MAGNKYITLNSGVDQLLASNNSSAGASDANKIVSLNASGLLDSSMLPPSSGLTINATPYTSNQVLTGSEQNVLIFDTTSGNLTVTLPASASFPALVHYFTNLNSSNNHHLEVIAAGSDMIQAGGTTGAVANVSYPPNDNPIGLISDGAGNWYYLSEAWLSQALNNPNSVITTDGAGNATFTPTLPVANGGTGLATLTAHNVLLGEGTSNVAFAAPGTAGIPLVSAGATSDPAFGTASVGGGGTGQTSFTVHGVLVGNTTSGLSVTAAGAAGTILTGNGASDPTFQAPTPTPNNIQVTASEDIAAGALVSLWNSSGLKVRNADNTSTSKQADGWAPSAISNTSTGTINMFSGPITGLSGLTVGTRYFLGTTGGTTATAPSSSGDLVQPVGIATASTVLQFNAGSVTQIA